MESVIGTFGAVGGIIVAVLLFAVGWWIVARARAGNARVRKAHHDPHQNDSRRSGQSGDAEDPQRDIPQ